MRSQADLAAGMAVEPPGEVELEQRHLDRAARAPDRRMSSSTGTGDGPSSSSMLPASSAVRFLHRRFEARRGRFDSRLDGTERLDHVLGVLDQRRAVADQLVAALGPRVERLAGHRHHLASRLGRQPRGDQRARTRRGLDHHRAGAEPGDDPVAVGEVARARLGARAAFRPAPARVRTAPVCRASFSGG